MTRDEIITQLFTGKNFNDVIGKMDPEHLRDDLRMEVALIVCEWTDDKIRTLYEDKRLDFYVVRVIINMLSNKYSPFFKKYRGILTEYKDNFQASFQDTIEAHDDAESHKTTAFKSPVDEWDYHAETERQTREEAEDRALARIDDLYWYDAQLLRLYVAHGNYRAIERETGIPFISCYKNIKKSITELKNKVNVNA